MNASIKHIFSSNQNQKVKIKGFLPLENFHIIPIYGILPENLKLSVKNTILDREKIGHCTLLNSLAKGLGFSGGFSGYVQEFGNNLIPFMQENQLLHLADLVTPRNLGYGVGVDLLRLRYQDISERLFFSSKSIPSLMFTGYDFDYENSLEDGHWLAYNYFSARGLNIKNYFENIKIARQSPNTIISLPIKSGSRRLIDFILGSGLLDIISPGFNLIGDQLMKPSGTKDKYVFELYFPKGCGVDSGERLSICQEFFDLFVDRIKESDCGWVEIIPYNENLVFLKGKDGEYDFVFRNQRDDKFEHQLYFPYLKRAEIPSFDDEYAFQRWYYFKFKGFRQKIAHQAEEKFYYEDGGIAANYPGHDVILRKFLNTEFEKSTQRGVKKNSCQDKRLPGFCRFELDSGKVLMVSDLVSIEDFKFFEAENSEYMKLRKTLQAGLQGSGGRLDNLYSVNNEHDETLPVAVTWYDVLKYIDWFNIKYSIETRLLNLNEYQEITPFELSVGNYYGGIAFYDKAGKDLGAEPPYMSECDFQNLYIRFKDPKFKMKNNVRFMDSNKFAEWVKEKTCIRSNSLTGFYGDKHILRQPTPFESTGKYKYMKIGFRLCYEVNLDY